MKIQTILLFKGLNLFLGKAKQTVSVTVVSLLLLISATASATPISNLFVFGDSLSDSERLPIFPQQIADQRLISIADFQMAQFGLRFWLRI